MKHAADLSEKTNITAAELQALLAQYGWKVSLACLTQWRAAGKGPRFVRLNPTARSRVLYPMSAVTEWLADTIDAANSQPQSDGGLPPAVVSTSAEKGGDQCQTRGF